MIAETHLKPFEGLNKKMKEDEVITFLEGHDPTQYIRSIESSYASNKVSVIISPPKQKIRIVEDTYRPFVWSKNLAARLKSGIFYSNKQVKVDKYDIGEDYFIFDNTEYKIDEKNFIVQDFDEDFSIANIYLESFQERKKYYLLKKREYNIPQPKECITGYGKDAKAPLRMDAGYKYLIHINPTSKSDKVVSSNPMFQYNRYGKPNYITGSYQNLIDFFREGGIDIFEKDAILLHVDMLTTQFAKMNHEERMTFYWNSVNMIDIFKNIPVSSICSKFKKVYKSKLYSDFSDYLMTHNKEVIQEELFDVKASEFLKFLDVLYTSEEIVQLFKDANLMNSFEVTLDDKKLELWFNEENDFTVNVKYRKSNLQFLESYTDLLNLVSTERHFYYMSPTEQYMIQTGKRLFKGFEDYSELKIASLDIETEVLPRLAKAVPRGALSPKTGRIFKIGLYDNKGTETILESPQGRCEKDIIIKTFEWIADTQPDILLTYNGEGFDYPYMIERLAILNNDKSDDFQDTIKFIREIFDNVFSKFDCYISKYKMFNRKEDSILKVGSDIKKYTQTNVFGMSVLDGMFAIMRAAAINNKIPNNKLKDNIKFAKVAKKNRVYVDGSKIGEIENDKRPYFLNEETGQYIVDGKQLAFSKNKFKLKQVKISHDLSTYYKNSKTLYLYEGANLKISNCENVFTINVNDICHLIKINKMGIDRFEKILIEKFKRLVPFLVKYDNVVAPQSGLGLKLKEEGHLTHFKALLRHLKSIRGVLSNMQLMYPQFDFNAFKETTGSNIVKQYLIDDLWETVKLDEIYSQANFLVSKWLPTTYQKVSTMGGATIWKMLLAAWSYNNNLAIPEYEAPRKFSGGLVGMVSSGYHGKIVKIDYSSLYPSEKIVHVPSPDIDITDIFDNLLSYVLGQRLKFKKKKNEHKAKGNSTLSAKYDKKQLPLKILINSFYGMLGASLISPWASIDTAQHITCSGRQHMRHLITWFKKRNFKVIYFHTDGANFVIPKDVDNYKYIGKGKKGGGNWLVEHEKHYTGVMAYIAEYNDTFMSGIMGVDMDGYAYSTINIAKGNAIFLKEENLSKKMEIFPIKEDEIIVSDNVKSVIHKNGVTFLLEGDESEYKTYTLDIVGGAILKKDQSEYIADFINTNAVVLLAGFGKKYIENYYEYITKIYNHDITITKIASRSRRTKSNEQYLNHIKGKNTRGKPLPRQAFMELLLRADEDIVYDVGDWVSYVNSGDKVNDAEFKLHKEEIGFFINNSETNYNQNILEQFQNIDKIKYILNESEMEGNFYFKTTTSRGLKSKFKLVFDNDGVEKLFLLYTANEKKSFSLSFYLDYLNSFDGIVCEPKKRTIDTPEGGKIEVSTMTVFLTKSILNGVLVTNPNQKIEYNVPKYIAKFNKAISPLLLNFNPLIRKTIPVKAPSERGYFTSVDCKLVNGIPFENKPQNQNNLEDLLIPTSEEVFLWNKLKLSPNSSFVETSFEYDEYYKIIDNNGSYIKVEYSDDAIKGSNLVEELIHHPYLE